VLDTLFAFNPTWGYQEISRFIDRLNALGWCEVIETKSKNQILKKGHRCIAVSLDSEQIKVSHWNTPTSLPQ